MKGKRGERPKTAKMIAVALNTLGLDKEFAMGKINEVEKLTGLPTTDVVLLGAESLVEAVLAE